MLPRFLAPDLDSAVSTLSLPEDEALHASRVLRLRPGAAVLVFDGRGRQRAGRIAEADRRRVTVTLGDAVAAASEPRLRVTLGQSLLKADKFDDVVRDAVMLGAASVVAVSSQRADVPARALDEGGRAVRWHRVAVAAAKQSGRAVVPDVRAGGDVAACLAGDESDCRVMLVEPAAGPDAPHAPRPLDASVLGNARSVLLLVGPEGGWTADEVRAAPDAGCRLVSLGARTLRADATPLVALSVLLHLSGDL